MRPAETCGCASSPCSSSRASSVRTVEGAQVSSGSAAIDFDATGCPLLRCSSTTAQRIRSWRWVSMMRLYAPPHRRQQAPATRPQCLARNAPSQSGLDLCLGVADDLVAALLRDRVDHDPGTVGLAHGAADDDLLLWQPHAAKLDRQALEVLGPSRRLGLRAGDLRHGPQTVKDLAGQADG